MTTVPTPVFNMMAESISTKGFISRCYAILLTDFLTLFPLRAGERWESDRGPFIDDQWEEALQAVPQYSLNVRQRLMQLYLLLRIHFTPARLHAIGILESSMRGKCSRNHGDLIKLSWRCPKLHLYWVGMLNTINSVFTPPFHSTPNRAFWAYWMTLNYRPPQERWWLKLFQARRVILQNWKFSDPPSHKEWIQCMGGTLRLEKFYLSAQ